MRLCIVQTDKSLCGKLILQQNRVEVMVCVFQQRHLAEITLLEVRVRYQRHFHLYVSVQGQLAEDANGLLYGSACNVRSQVFNFLIITEKKMQ